MESNGGEAMDPTTATRLLGRREDMRERIDRRGPSRGYAWLLVWSALLLCVYVGVFLATFSDFEAGSADPGGYTYTNLMLLPVLMFSGLASGARERFSIRSRPSFLQVVGYIVAILGFMVLGGLSIADMSYPWWLNVLAPTVLFAVMAVAPLRRLAATRSEAVQERWRDAPLAISTRWTTSAIGVVLGVLAATSVWTWFPIVSAALLMGTLIPALIGWRMPWGLMRTGYQWGPTHWSLFAAATAALFTLVVLLTSTDLVTPPVAVLFGVIACAAMIVAAISPRRAARR